MGAVSWQPFIFFTPEHERSKSEVQGLVEVLKNQVEQTDKNCQLRSCHLTTTFVVKLMVKGYCLALLLGLIAEAYCKSLFVRLIGFCIEYNFSRLAGQSTFRC